PVTRREMDRLKDRKRCSSYRQRQRNERESLHKEVRVLTAKLHTAKEERALSSGWEVCAQRQLEARLESENEQTRLCEAIRARAAYIREFQELAQRRNATVLGVEAVNTPCEQQNATEYTACTSIPFCKLFVQDLDTIYAQTDDCLQAFDEVTPGQDGTSSIKVWKADSEAGCFQFMERKELQCNFDQACQTLWDAAQLPHRQEGRHEFKGVPDPDNTKALKLRGLDDAALKAHANYRYYEFFSRKAVEYRLYKQLQRGVPTFEIWKDQGFSRIAKAVDLKQIVNTMEFKFYERYVKAFHQKVKGDLNAWRDPTAVMVARGATEAEMTARTLILVNSGMKEDYVKALLGMTKPGRPGVLLKGKELENHIDYKYLELFRNAKERLDGKQFKWENLEDIIK
ncbi:hypothetical protein PC121_g17939, partial [Phytophthora cactorum]